ncbi:MAG: hypothetical protein CVU23_09960 [Betaproteobacteria bacterium HGW-Betaproteobacteria-17]|nr:MAG: hypothetical protein CVU23_09960 [Betaproteobacteria bacterium HGW-Betaproteobacteria-17]
MSRPQPAAVPNAAMNVGFEVHIMLVSAQAAANLLPALDPDLKPREAVLLVSAPMRERADALERVLQEAKIKTTREQLDNEHDYDALSARLLDLAAGRSDQSIALNVTGGTKLMALAAQPIAHEAGWPVFYVDVDTDEVVWIGTKARPPHRLTEQLRLRHYLAAYGFDSEKRERARPPPGHDDLIKTLLHQIGSLEAPLAQLNWLTQLAQDRRSLSVELDARQRDSIGLDTLLRNFENAGLLRVEAGRLSFSDSTSRDYVKGGWLERHVFTTVCRHVEDLGIRDQAANLEIKDRAGLRNELDVAFMARNRLFVIECKTARMDRPEAPKANDTLFKLSEVSKRVGGLGTRGLLASYRPLREPECRLAQALGIELACGSELANLDDRLKRWVRR